MSTRITIASIEKYKSGEPASVHVFTDCFGDDGVYIEAWERGEEENYCEQIVVRRDVWEALVEELSAKASESPALLNKAGCNAETKRPRDENEKLVAENVKLLGKIDEWKSASGLVDSSGDPDGIEPHHLAKSESCEIKRLREEPKKGIGVTGNFSASVTETPKELMQRIEGGAE